MSSLEKQSDWLLIDGTRTIAVARFTYSAQAFQRVFQLASCWLALCSIPASGASRSVAWVVQPESLTLTGPPSEHRLLVSEFWSDGYVTDVAPRTTFTSRHPTVVSVTAEGVCRAQGEGTAEIDAEFNGQHRRIPVLVTGSSLPHPPSFRQDIEPILTRAGCNQGACHGKLAGQNGFKLSLRGYAPELDYSWLTSDLGARRINPAFPEDSLLVLKALGAVAHEGRQRFAEGSRYHQTLVHWIAARAPGPDTNEANVAKLELLPGPRVMRRGDAQPLLARAHYADGRVRDVTWLTQFFANDANTASVTPDGLVTALRHGETSIRAHFQGQVEAITITIPYENKVAPREFVTPSHPVDTPVLARLKALNLPPSPLCDDSTLLRRVMLDLTGTLPTTEQVRAFAADKTKPKRANLIDRLLGSPEFVDFWTLQFADLLQNRKERDHDVRGTKGVRAFHAWLRGEIAANRPWSELAREIVTARGSAAEHPEIGYFIYNVGEKRNIEESDTPDAVAQAFLGTRIGCARCHNHPLEKFTQDDFYHFAAFFSKVQLKRGTADNAATLLIIGTREEEEQRKRLEEIEKRYVESTNAVAKAQANDMEKAQKNMDEQRRKLEEARLQLQKVSLKMPTVLQPRTKQPMAPQALDRQPCAVAPGEDPRERLAAWMIDPNNPHFSGAMVNRLWKHFLGVGLVEPVDDLRLSNPPSNPELWKSLNAEFVRSGYDLRHLMRLILNSRTYQLSAMTRSGNEADHRFYSHYYARRLPAEVMLDALASATGVPDDYKGYPVGTRAVQLTEPGVSSYFLSLFGRSDRVTACACERNGEVTLPQLLHLQNGDATVKKLRSEGSRLQSWLSSSRNDAQVITELYWATLSRPPAPKELTAVQQVIGHGDERAESFRDLFWALLNSKEFAFNH